MKLCPPEPKVTLVDCKNQQSQQNTLRVVQQSPSTELFRYDNISHAGYHSRTFTEKLTNSMVYGTRKFNAAFKRALE